MLEHAYQRVLKELQGCDTGALSVGAGLVVDFR